MKKSKTISRKTEAIDRIDEIIQVLEAVSLILETIEGDVGEIKKHLKGQAQGWLEGVLITLRYKDSGVIPGIGDLIQLLKLAKQALTNSLK